MIAFFDTSCLVAAFVNSEPQNANCLSRLEAHKRDGAVAAHSLAECFHVLTGRKKIGAVLAAELIKTNIAERFSIVTLSKEDYLKTLTTAHANGVRGGAIFDALILMAARKVKADRIFTLCPADFRVFAPDLADKVQTP